MYNIQTEKFNGPFEVLVDLIDKKKLSINELSLSEIADQYLDYIKKIEQFPTEEVASFVVVAATLMLIKSRSLMPSLKLTDEEETEIEDLEEKLKLYKKFRNNSKDLEKIFGKNVIFSRPSFYQIENILPLDQLQIKPKDLSQTNLEIALQNALGKIPPPKPKLPEVKVKKTISLEQKIDSLIKRIEDKVSLCFSDTHNKNKECQKVDLVVSFLALLELTKRGFIIVKQGEDFGEIHISKVTNNE